ncbi:MAG TPA: hypothetical protein VH436_24205 [Vicinamibacterales bacterium]
MRLALLLGLIAAVGAGSNLSGQAQPAPRAPAVPVDPVTAIVDAFRSHPIVALGEGAHGNEQAYAFRVSLLHDRRFTDVVNDIVVESGTARYQDAMDRYVRGEDVPDQVMRELRENTVVATPVWDRPIYAEFFTEVRNVNRSLPRDRQVRVLLGDPPIDWTSVTTADEYRAWLSKRDSFPADLIKREVIAKGRHALVVYGDGHFQARSERPGKSLAALLEASGSQLFIIMSAFADLTKFQSDAGSWRAPSLVIIGGTPIGAAPYELFFGPAPPVDFFRANPLIENHYDAMLYLGPPSSMTSSPFSYPRCAEPDYAKMRVARMVLSGMPANVGDRLTAECAAAASAFGPGRDRR